MKLQIIGTGGIWNKENSASYLIDDYILVDFPNGCYKGLVGLGKKPENINHVLITHFHGDHFFDLPIYLLKMYKEENWNVNIYCPKDGKKKIETLFKLSFLDSSKEALKKLKINYNYLSRFKIDEYSIEKVEVNHGDFKPAYGYIFKTDKLTVGFTGDTAYCNNVDYMASICDYLICDSSLIYGNEAHMGLDDIKKLATKYPEHKFVVSHMFENTIAEAKKIKLKNVIVPKDGDILLDEKK